MNEIFIHQIFIVNISWIFTKNVYKYSQKIHDEYLMNENSMHDLFIRNPLNMWQIFSDYVCKYSWNIPRICLQLFIMEYSWNIHFENVWIMYDICHVTYSINITIENIHKKFTMNIWWMKTPCKIYSSEIHWIFGKYSANMCFIQKIYVTHMTQDFDQLRCSEY